MLKRDQLYETVHGFAQYSDKLKWKYIHVLTQCMQMWMYTDVHRKYMDVWIPTYGLFGKNHLCWACAMHSHFSVPFCYFSPKPEPRRSNYTTEYLKENGQTKAEGLKACIMLIHKLVAPMINYSQLLKLWCPHQVPTMFYKNWKPHKICCNWQNCHNSKT